MLQYKLVNLIDSSQTREEACEKINELIGSDRRDGATSWLMADHPATGVKLEQDDLGISFPYLYMGAQRLYIEYRRRSETLMFLPDRFRL